MSLELNKNQLIELLKDARWRIAQKPVNTPDFQRLDLPVIRRLDAAVKELDVPPAPHVAEQSDPAPFVKRVRVTGLYSFYQMGHRMYVWFDSRVDSCGPLCRSREHAMERNNHLLPKKYELPRDAQFEAEPSWSKLSPSYISKVKEIMASHP